jgi:hypothetical protein
MRVAQQPLQPRHNVEHIEGRSDADGNLNLHRTSLDRVRLQAAETRLVRVRMMQAILDVRLR